MAILELQHINKSYGGEAFIRDMSLKLEPGHILALLGPSGCGKTTMLRLIAGLERPDSGQILFGGQDLSGIPPHRRNFGMMFQEYALFPHRNVFRNVAFGLEMQGLTEEDVRVRVKEMLQLVGLEDLATRRINELSGGERQRVALARSLAPQPRLLMLDEPFAALDRALRERLMLEVRQIIRTVGVSAIFVTHDQAEALAVADRIAVIRAGVLQQIAAPEELHRNPANLEVARFLGLNNILPAEACGPASISTPVGILGTVAKTGDGKNLFALLRPESASLDAISEYKISGRVIQKLFRGRYYQLIIATGDDLQLSFEVRQEPPEIGQTARLFIDPEGVMIFRD